MPEPALPGCGHQRCVKKRLLLRSYRPAIIRRLTFYNVVGETLLVQLGTANPGKTPEEKQGWNDGLRQVLKELRKKSIKDPNGIAVEIAKYRRTFLNDATRVINL